MTTSRVVADATCDVSASSGDKTRDGDQLNMARLSNCGTRVPIGAMARKLSPPTTPKPDDADPERAALAQLFASTVKRFPTRDTFERQHPEHGPAIQRLVADGRYLVNITGRGSDGKIWSRLAITLPGVLALNGTAATEISSLRRNHAGLVKAFRAKKLPLSWQYCTIAQLQTLLRSKVTPHGFARRLTLYCSPRLCGAYDDDPMGFAGAGHCRGMVDQKSGYYKAVSFEADFDTYDLPDPPTGRLLNPEDRSLRAKIDDAGRVTIWDGPSQLVALSPGLGSRALAVLMMHPGASIDSLDLQTAEHFEVSLPLDEPDEEQRRALGVSTKLSAAERGRLAALVRRLAALESLSMPDAKQPVPRWAAKPAKRANELRAAIKAELPNGIAGDFGVIKNASRAVGRALKDLLKDPMLDPIRPHVVVGEQCVYRPKRLATGKR